MIQHGYATNWGLDNAVDLIRKLQPEARRSGYHLALAGGVLNVGHSDKDLDIVALPMGGHTQDWAQLSEAILEVADVMLSQITTNYPNSRDRTVFTGEHYNGRIDIIRIEVPQQ